MKFTIPASHLNNALSLLQRSIDNKSTLPVLNNFLLELQEDKAILTSTILEQTLRLEITENLDIQSTGSTTVPLKLLTNYCALLKDVAVQFELDENETLKVTAARDKTEIKCIKAEEFPELPDMDVQMQARTVSHFLAQAFDRSTFACSNDIARAALTGVSLTIQKSSVFIAATDSYRLSEQRFELEQTSGEDIKVIIPKRAAESLITLLSFDEQPVEIQAKKNQIVFQIGSNMVFMTRLIDGNFPAYRQIIPEKHATQAQVNMEELQTALKKTAIFSEELKKAIEISVSGTTLTLSTVQSQVGSSEQSLDTNVVGENNSISINAQYLLDVLPKFKGQDISLGMNESHLPLSVSSSSDPNFSYIIMPLRK